MGVRHIISILKTHAAAYFLLGFIFRETELHTQYPAFNLQYQNNKTKIKQKIIPPIVYLRKIHCTLKFWLQTFSFSASCKLSVRKATVLYQGERVKLQERFKNGMLHGDKVSFFCKNKEKKCSYTEEAQCMDGTIEIPKCFKGKWTLECPVRTYTCSSPQSARL